MILSSSYRWAYIPRDNVTRIYYNILAKSDISKLSKGLFGYQYFKKPPAKLFGFGKFSGHGKDQSWGGVWLHLALTFCVTVPSFRPPHVSYDHSPHSLYWHTTFNIPLLTLAIICPQKPPKTLHLMTLHAAAGQMLMMWLSCASSRNKRKEEISLVQAGKVKGKFFLCANVLAIWETMFQLQFCAEFAKDMLRHPELLMHVYRRQVQFCEPSLTS